MKQTSPKAPPAHPQVVQPPVSYTVAHFTASELSMLRGVCRDADNETARKVLEGAIARAARGVGAK